MLAVKKINKSNMEIVFFNSTKIRKKITEKLKRGEKLTAEEQSLHDEMNNGIETLPPTEPSNSSEDFSGILKVAGFAVGAYVVYRVFIKKG